MNPVVTVRRHLSTLTFDWTTNGACIDVTPNGGALSNADKGIVYRDCLPVRNADFNVWKIYQLKIQDPGGSDVCFGAVKVLPIAALYSAPSIHYIIPSDDKSHVANHPEFGDISIESVLPTVGISDLRIYPNPGTEVIQLSFDAQSEEDLTVFITDIAGRILSTHKYEIVGGSNLIVLNMSNFAQGIYFVRLDSDSMHETLRWIKGD